MRHESPASLKLLTEHSLRDQSLSFRIYVESSVVITGAVVSENVQFGLIICLGRSPLSVLHIDQVAQTEIPRHNSNVSLSETRGSAVAKKTIVKTSKTEQLRDPFCTQRPLCEKQERHPDVILAPGLVRRSDDVNCKHETSVRVRSREH